MAASMRSALVLIALTAALPECSSPARVDASWLDAVEAMDALDTGSSDAVLVDAPVDRPAPPARRTLAPSSRSLADLVGLASNPGDLPLGADVSSAARRAFYFRKMRELGIHRVRRDFRWSEIEPVQGTFVFDDQERLVTEAQAAGVDVLASLLYGNLWATATPNHDEFYPPDDPGTFARYAAQTVAHFRGRVNSWEVWNEPNAGFRFWRPSLRGDSRAYGRLLSDTVAAVRTLDPAVRVAFGGTVFIPQLITGGVLFATQAFAANPGLAASLDAYAFHAYNVYAPRAGPESGAPNEVPLLDKIALTAGMLEHEGVSTQAPLWLTEIGWPSTGDVNETQQAQWSVRAVLLAALGGVDGVYLYTLGDGPHPEAFPPEDAFGLVHYDANYGDGADPEDKPVFVALRTLLSTVGAFRVEAREDVPGHPDDAFVVRLVDGVRHAWAVWVFENVHAPVAWTPPSRTSPYLRVTLDGANGSLPAGQAVTLSPQPVLVLEPGP